MRNKTKNKMKNKRKTRGGAGTLPTNVKELIDLIIKKDNYQGLKNELIGKRGYKLKGGAEVPNAPKEATTAPNAPNVPNAPKEATTTTTEEHEVPTEEHEVPNGRPNGATNGSTSEALASEGSEVSQENRRRNVQNVIINPSSAAGQTISPSP